MRVLTPGHVATETTLARPELATSPGRILSARTLEEVRDRLETVLGGLYADARFQLLVADHRGALVCVPPRAPEAPPPAAVGLRLVRPAPSLRAPLVDELERPIGALVIEAAPGAPEFTHLHSQVLEGVAALVSIVVQRLRPEAADRQRARLELDRKAAREMQRRLMHARLPAGVGVTAHAEYLPSLDVGGDFYGLRQLADGTVAAVIGDVSGNGVSAALLMSRVAADLERGLATGATPSRVLEAVNAALTDAESESFVTACCLRIDARRRALTVANAGHLPMLVRRAGGRVLLHGDASGLPLGMVAAGEYQDEALSLERGDLVVLVTDGVLEALDHPSGRLGLELLRELVREGPHDARALHARLRAAIHEAQARAPLDDVTWLVLQLD